VKRPPEKGGTGFGGFYLSQYLEPIGAHNLGELIDSRRDERSREEV